MEIVDNALMLLIPGAMDAGLGQFRFWWSLAVSLVVAGMAAYPVVRILVARGRGHAAVHKHHADASRSLPIPLTSWQESPNCTFYPAPIVLYKVTLILALQSA
jgi:hypothetical protein